MPASLAALALAAAASLAAAAFPTPPPRAGPRAKETQCRACVALTVGLAHEWPQLATSPDYVAALSVADRRRREASVFELVEAAACGEALFADFDPEPAELAAACRAFLANDAGDGDGEGFNAESQFEAALVRGAESVNDLRLAACARVCRGVDDRVATLRFSDEYLQARKRKEADDQHNERLRQQYEAYEELKARPTEEPMMIDSELSEWAEAQADRMAAEL